MADNPYATVSNNIIGISQKNEEPVWKKKFKEKMPMQHNKNLIGMMSLKENRIKRSVRVAAASSSPKNAADSKKVTKLPVLGSEISSDGGHEDNSARHRGLSRDASHRLSVSNSQRELIASKTKRVLG